MKLTNFTKLIGIGTMAIIMTGCGGSSGGSSAPSAPTSVPGGSANAPAVMSLDMKNDISSNHATNYFQYTGVEGEKLIIDSTIDGGISREESIECQMSGGKGMGIFVYDANLDYEPDYSVGCRTDLTFEFPTDGTYVFHFNNSSSYYGGNSGYFYATSVKP